MGSFIQVIEYDTSKIDEIKALGDKVRAERGGEGPRIVRVTEDRERRGHYYTIVEFDSYESAMANSDHPTTQAFAAELAKLVDGPPSFLNLDVVEAWEA